MAITPFAKVMKRNFNASHKDHTKEAYEKRVSDLIFHECKEGNIIEEVRRARRMTNKTQDNL